MVVSNYEDRRVRAFLHDSHPHRAGCAARLFPPGGTCSTLAHATMCYSDLLNASLVRMIAHGDTVRVAWSPVGLRLRPLEHDVLRTPCTTGQSRETWQ
jgi:hypothetical protein